MDCRLVPCLSVLTLLLDLSVVMASSPDHTASSQAAAAGEPSPAVVAATTATTDSNIQPDRPASFGPGPWEREEEQTFVRLTYEPIDVMECLARVRKRHSGAIVMFAGG